MGKPVHGKRYRADLEKVPAQRLATREAVRALKQLVATKFDQTVELAIWLGIDPKQSDQQVRGAISLPHGIGKTKRVVAFCDEEQAKLALGAGAVAAGADELIQKVQQGWTDFDVALSTPAMMRSVSRLGRILGPQGKMPSPKAGTVVNDVAAAVKEYAAGKIEFRNDEGGNLHVPVGKLSFDEDRLTENVEAFLARVWAMRPATAKGQYIRKAALSGTMTPSVALEVG